MIRGYISTSANKCKPARIIHELKKDQLAGKFDANVPIPKPRQISAFLKTVSNEIGSIQNYQELLYWAKGKLCESTEQYNNWHDLSSVMVLAVPKFEDVEDVDDEGNVVSNSTVCIIISSKEILDTGVMRTPYVFTVRALHGVLNNDLGDQMFMDIEVGESDFASQWAQTAMNQLNGKIVGMQRSSYTDVMGHSDSADDA